MNKIIKWVLASTVLFFLFTCKKSTTIDVTVYNYALDESVPGATVVLVERKEDGLFASDPACKEIATAVCNADGKCSFNREKLKTNKKFKYFLGLKEAYGVKGSYPCSGKTSGFLDVGTGQAQILNADIFDGFVRLRFNNMLNPSQPGDSLIVGLSTIEYPNPKGGVVQGGGGILYGGGFYAIGNPAPSYQSVILTEPVKTKGQRLRRYVRKHKLGVITLKIDTIKVYPNTTTIVDIDW
jgi:hypothetical protein